MSRYSGSQGRGASRQLAAVRRREAEMRQAVERKRDAIRAALETAPPPLLTDAERAALKEALRVAILTRLLERGRA